MDANLLSVLNVVTNGRCKMEIIVKKLADLKQYLKNPRKNDAGVKYLANSIKEFGFKVPIVIDKDNVIVCGHTRYKAAKQLKLKEVPCIMADDLTEEQVKAFRLADNQVAGLATWDNELLDECLVELKMDMALFGFEIGDTLKNSCAEIDVADFDDEQFDYECPCCGFRFNRG